MSNIVENARKLAMIAHKNQYRRDGETPYFSHVEAVANSLSEDIRKAVGYLHDVFEDCPLYTVKIFKEYGITDEVIRYCVILNKNNYDSYPEYIRETKKYPVTKDVKKKDIQHNNSDKPGKNQRRKYLFSLQFLNDEIDYDTLVNELNKKV